MKKLFSLMRKALFVIGISFSVLVNAQDFHLSQYDAAPINLNPAMTGLFEGFYRIHAHYRTQWSAIATNPFQTFAASYDMPLDKFAVGGQVMDYTAGAGNYNVFSFVASGSYDLILDKKKENHHLCFGLQGGIMQKSIQFSRLSWDIQYTTLNGGSFDPSVPSGETFGDESLLMPDLNAGLIYYYTKDASRVNPFLGFAAHHLTNPKESFYAEDNRLPVRYTIHGGARFSINNKFQLLPKFFLMRQTNDRELTMSIHGHYYMPNNDVYLIFGPTFRISGPLVPKTNFYESEDDAAIIELGLKMGAFIYRVSYDINTSSLDPYTNNRGGLELSVTFIGKRGAPDRIRNCPRL